MAAPPQYPQLLRALAMQRLGAGDSGKGAVADWAMLSRGAHRDHRERAGVAGELGATPPGIPAHLLEEIRKRLALKAAITGRPAAPPAGQLGTQYAPASPSTRG